MTIEQPTPHVAAQDPIRAIETPPQPVATLKEGPDPALFANRELSWMDFNDRVLQLAEDPATPLLERVKFAAIWTSNLDEFFMVRVAGLHDQVDAGVREPLDDRRSPSQTIDGIRDLAIDQYTRVHDLLERSLRPELAEHGISIVGMDDVSDEDRASLQERYRRQIYPVLTPLAVGLGRPFPYISNLSLSLAVLVRDPTTSQTTFARVKVPKEMLPRFVPVEGAEGDVFVPLEELIARNLNDLFPGMQILDHGYFRVTRDADFEVSDEADDLLRAVEAELRRRRFGEAVRVEVQAGMDPELRHELTHALGVEERQVYDVPGLIDLNDLWGIVKLPGYAELRDPPWSPVTQPRLQLDDETDMFTEIRRADILVHHPYDSFSTSVERFVEQA
ncbi:MAG: polyphosphate kinase, partial [Solirubrobacteraceae bacterium]|nr:polyphosphate kinase [Solirubrobacteraceae bacterium]